MRPEHRHELKTNELAEWLVNLPQWAKENAKSLICVTALIATVAGFYAWRAYQKNVVIVNKQLELTSLINEITNTKPTIIKAQAKGFDTSYNLLTIADKLKAFAGKTKNRQMSALALIKAGDAIRTELHYRAGAPSQQDITGQITKAATCYTDALTKTSQNPSLTASAKFGLGLCAEEIGNYRQAEQIYRNITEADDFKSTVAAAQAKLRLEALADYQKKITFYTPAEKKSVSPPVRLDEQPVGDTNLPAQ